MMNTKELDALSLVLEHVIECEGAALQPEIKLLCRAYRRELGFNCIRFGIKTSFWLVAATTMFLTPVLVERAVRITCPH